MVVRGFFISIFMAFALPVFAADELPDDSVLVAKISQAFAARTAFQNSLIQVHSERGFILLTGQVGSEEAKRDATNTIVFASSDIRRIFNELNVVPLVDASSADSDAALAQVIKTDLALMNTALSERVQVITHQAVVYLLGAFTREEQTEIATRVSGIAGVASIKTMFETLP